MNEQNQPIENSTEKQSVVTGMSRIKIFVGLGVLALGVLGTAGFGVYRAYAQSASDAFTVAVAKALHLPAIKLQDKKILYTDYIEDLKAIRVMKEYDTAQRAAGESEQRTPGADITEEQMTDQVLWRLVNNSLVEAAAEKYAVTVSDEDVAGLKSGMLQNFKNETELELELLKRYGWNLGDYERKVIRPFILQSKLAKKITEDADNSSFFTIICILSVPSKSTTKSIAPCPRIAITLPATENSLPSYSKSLKFSRTSDKAKSRGALAGYESIFFDFKISILRSLAARISSNDAIPT
jgi:hypothetical protein